MKRTKKINQVICGNSKRVLKKLDSESVDLCYLDPPFFANRIFEAKGKYGKISSFNDEWKNDLPKYLEFMSDILNECHRLLKKTGSLYLHCDWHASHYLKVELDKIFEQKESLLWVSCQSYKFLTGKSIRKENRFID